jgi:hypothetical protein
MVLEITDPWPGELTHAIPINTRWSSPSSWNALRKPACRQIRDISAGSPTELAAVSLNLFPSPRGPTAGNLYRIGPALLSARLWFARKLV